LSNVAFLPKYAPIAIRSPGEVIPQRKSDAHSRFEAGARDSTHEETIAVTIKPGATAAALRLIPP